MSLLTVAWMLKLQQKCVRCCQKANQKKENNLQNGVFDADIDSVYYVKGEPGAYFTFTPTAGSSVSVLRPELNHELGTASYGNATFSTEEVTSNNL